MKSSCTPRIESKKEGGGGKDGREDSSKERLNRNRKGMEEMEAESWVVKEEEGKSEDTRSALKAADARKEDEEQKGNEDNEVEGRNEEEEEREE